MKKFSFLMSGLLAVSLFAPQAQAANDLPSSHRFYEEIGYLMDQRIISGYDDGTVRPDQTVTRAEAAIMIGQLKGLDGTQRGTKFTDVTAGQRASGFIASAEQAGFMNGRTDGTFQPYAPITRGDMAIVTDNVFDLAFIATSYFTDVSPNMRAYDAISRIIGGNIATGYPDDTFKPNQAITRGQFSAFLARALEPRFKNDTHRAGTFLRDKTKTYRYAETSGTSVHTYEDVPRVQGLEMGFMWVTRNPATGDTTYYGDAENRSGLYLLYPYSEADTDLIFPAEVGKKFNVGSEFQPMHQITAVNVSITTPYKTFTNAIEVTVPYDPVFHESGGFKYYVAPGHHIVKVFDSNGNVVQELIGVE